MYGNTGKSVTALVKGIKSEGVDVAIFRVPQDDTGHILAAAWKAAGLTFAMPTCEYKMFPPTAQVIEDVMVKKIKNRKVLRIGSYGWVGGAEKDFRTKTEKAGWDIMESIEFQGSPDESELAAIEKAGKQLAKEIKKFSAGQV